MQQLDTFHADDPADSSPEDGGSPESIVEFDPIQEQEEQKASRLPTNFSDDEIEIDDAEFNSHNVRDSNFPVSIDFYL